MTTRTVRPGDTLGRISKAVYGDAAHWPLLATANSLANPNQLFVGQVLRIPSLSGPAPGVAPAGDSLDVRIERAFLRTAKRLLALAPAPRS